MTKQLVAQEFWTAEVIRTEEYAGKFYSEKAEVEVEGQIWQDGRTLTIVVKIDGDQHYEEVVEVAINEDCIWTEEEQMAEAICEEKLVWKDHVA